MLGTNHPEAIPGERPIFSKYCPEFDHALFSKHPAGCLSVPVAREVVLDYIVERKRMDDLCGSIIDGRFREQKVLFYFCCNA